jgi:glucosamine--fructose-6-phosphate aminotransferase (isomerizing)
MTSAFRAEIEEQPAVAERLLANAAGPIQGVAEAIRERDPAALVIAARGTSDHAATFGKYILEIRNHLPVALAAPSAFGIYGASPRVGRLCVLGISQSGASVDICTVLERAAEQGAMTVALTNDVGSRLARAAEYVLDLGAGPELSVPASKTYTASLLQLAMLSAALDPDAEFEAALRTVPEGLATVLTAEAGIEPMVDALLHSRRMAVLGRGYHLATAEEVALKITETCYSVAEARSLADFLHGPIAAVEAGFPLVLLEAGGPALAQVRELGTQLGGLGASVLRISDQEDAPGRSLILNTGLPESLTPLPFAVAGQLLALRLALARGLDPDRPRGLRKVTITN